MIINSIFILATLLFSGILVRGIYKNIRARKRIEALTKEVKVLNERLQIMEEQETEFVSIASHQLRAPLAVIKGYTSMILEGTFGDIPDPVRDVAEKLYKSSEKVVASVEELLVISRGEGAESDQGTGGS